MWRGLATIILLSSLLALTACSSSVLQSLSESQEPGENYALAEGVRCTSPKMIDGDLNSAGSAIYPEIDELLFRFIRGYRLGPRAEVILPEKKLINKIVIYSEHLDRFSVLAHTEKRLFGIDMSFQDDLDREAITDDLLSVLESNGASFSSDAKVRAEEKGQEWWVLDRNMARLIRRESGDELNIYRGTWDFIKGFENNARKKIVIRTSVVTDRVRIVISNKSSAKHQVTETEIVDGNVTTRRKLAPAEIQEIELYGAK